MSFPEPLELFDAVDATWAPKSISVGSPFTLREGAGGGKRVSAATLSMHAAEFDSIAINEAARRMRDMAQNPLFMIRDGEVVLDDALENLGYCVVDPVNYFACSVDQVADLDIHDVTPIRCEAPLTVQCNIWSKGGIGPERLEVMERSCSPKTYLLGRYKERPVASVFVAIQNGIGMLHALEVDKDWRRNGIGRELTIASAKWARENGASTFGLLAVKENQAATGLYEGLGMSIATSYHYRMIARFEDSR